MPLVAITERASNTGEFGEFDVFQSLMRRQRRKRRKKMMKTQRKTKIKVSRGGHCHSQLFSHLHFFYFPFFTNQTKFAGRARVANPPPGICEELANKQIPYVKTRFPKMLWYLMQPKSSQSKVKVFRLSECLLIWLCSNIWSLFIVHTPHCARWLDIIVKSIVT